MFLPTALTCAAHKKEKIVLCKIWSKRHCDEIESSPEELHNPPGPPMSLNQSNPITRLKCLPSYLIPQCLPGGWRAHAWPSLAALGAVQVALPPAVRAGIGPPQRPGMQRARAVKARRAGARQSAAAGSSAKLRVPSRRCPNQPATPSGGGRALGVGVAHPPGPCVLAYAMGTGCHRRPSLGSLRSGAHPRWRGLLPTYLPR